MEKERVTVHLEELKRKKLAESGVSHKFSDEADENKKPEKDSDPTFEDIMKNPVKLIAEDSKALVRLAKRILIIFACNAAT